MKLFKTWRTKTESGSERALGVLPRESMDGEYFDVVPVRGPKNGEFRLIPLHCARCDAYFPSKHALVIHLKSEGHGSHVCSCEKVFLSKGALKQHTKTTGHTKQNAPKEDSEEVKWKETVKEVVFNNKLQLVETLANVVSKTTKKKERKEAKLCERKQKAVANFTATARQQLKEE